MTYDPGRRGESRVPVLRNEWREPLRAQRDPLAGDSGRVRSNRDEHQHWPKQSWLGRFVSTYGWRAYALPVLVVITVMVIYQTITGTTTPAPTAQETVEGPPTIGAGGTAIVGAPPKGLTEFDANLPTGILPEGGPFTQAGNRTWRVVPGGTPQVGQGTAKVFRYTVEIEDGVDATTFGGDDAFARMVEQTLANPKSWIHNPQFGFVRVDASAPEPPDFRVSLTSPMTIRDGCGYEIQLEASCYNPAFHPVPGSPAEPRVFINEARWVRGAVPFQGDIGSYRQYLLNHEIGHAIGYHQHSACEENGALAPVMMQQTFSTSNADLARFDPDSITPDDKTCRFNPWPYPIA
ncbi:MULTISPECIES: DUF3152 domain-containing protein [Mycolicibacterium]|uniref:DUF3152 domain-containing protein n=1 Tax=Mycolicibacterium TaxID=1866885 RepID=UPI000F83DCF0|nr:DUF3152 domain-containing protein [Mycolicibacterium chitae]MCV7105969.1 DUF3152 domain-containing protein [Mycolicibacterium chitae]